MAHQRASGSGRQRMAPLRNDLSAFHEVLRGSKRILALCGAGLSAASGLPTFRGAGGLWRGFKSQDLATEDAFEDDPGMVWLFYSYRRHTALKAKPNAGHYALAELAKKVPGFMCLSQNVDGLHVRAGHPKEKLGLLHASIMDVKCFNHDCDYIERDNHRDPLCPALAPASDDGALVDSGAPGAPPILDPNTLLARIDPDDLPHCPRCDDLLRPGVVWFGESLPEDVIAGAEAWIRQGKIDLMLVVGTQATVWPAAGYVGMARGAGAAVAVVNMDDSCQAGSHQFEFIGDAAEWLPKMLEPLIGRMRVDGTFEDPVSAA